MNVVRMFGLTDGGSNRRRARVAVRRFIDDRVVEYEDLGSGRFRLWAPSEAVSTGYATARQPGTPFAPMAHILACIHNALQRHGAKPPDFP